MNRKTSFKPDSILSLALCALLAFTPAVAWTDGLLFGQPMEEFVSTETPTVEVPAEPSEPEATETPNDETTEAGFFGGTYCSNGKCDTGTHTTVSAPIELAKIEAPNPLPYEVGVRAREEWAKRRSSEPDFNLINRLAKITWDNALKGRTCSSVMRCRGTYVKGNRSKGYCAAALKESLVGAGLCAGYFRGHAIQLHTQSLLVNTCPAFELNSTKDPLKAPAASVIIYKRSSHGYGHIEIKIPVTAQLLDMVHRDPELRKRGGRNLKVGDYLYCSDFCRATPTFGDKSNPVVGIYSLK